MYKAGKTLTCHFSWIAAIIEYNMVYICNLTLIGDKVTDIALIHKRDKLSKPLIKYFFVFCIGRIILIIQASSPPIKQKAPPWGLLLYQGSEGPMRALGFDSTAGKNCRGGSRAREGATQSLSLRH